MDQNTAYQYKALNEDSYNSLAAFAVSTPATVTLHPGLLTIVITGDDANEVGKFIDREGLDFHINPIEFHDETLGAVIDCETTDAGTLRKIIYRMMGERSALLPKLPPSATARRKTVTCICAGILIAQTEKTASKVRFRQ